MPVTRTRKPKLITGHLESTSRVVKNTWIDYMGKDISPKLLNGLTADCADRSRIILQEYDSQRIADAIDVIDILLSIFFDSDGQANKDQTNEDLDMEGMAQKLFQRGDISDTLAVRLALERVTPRFYTANKNNLSNNPDWNDSENKDENLFGIDGQLPNAPQLFLATLALRDAFTSARMFMEVKSYPRFYLDCGYDDDTELDDLFHDCEYQAQEMLGEVITLCEFAAEKTACSLEAITQAEAMHDLDELRQIALTQKKLESKQIEKRVISNRSKQAAFARHERTRQLKEFALSLFAQGEFKSTLQAARELFPQVQEHGHQIGRPLSPERGEKTLYEWLLESK